MKYLGVDFGGKRVGLSTANSEDRIAFPYVVLDNDKHLVSKIIEIINKEKIVRVVIGESSDYKGKPNAIMSKIEKFKIGLEEKTDLPISWQPEFLTSAQAKHLQGENKMHDASAATIILQSYLDQFGQN